jgi:tRNA/rRNA methyltransferase/tRNA (cytidine32/uridine32-2'-O)-methyltransferase
MKNMGLSRLRLVSPGFSTAGVNAASFDAAFVDAASLDATLSESGFAYGGNLAVIQARAIHAADVWEKAETFDSLAAAVKDCALVIGTTRRRGRHRKQVTMTPAEAAAFIKGHSGPAALVFGNERTGLEDHEIDICNVASHIPVDEAFPSINLSHAVQIYAYELFLSLASLEKDAVKGQWVPLDEEAIEALVRDVTGNLGILGFYRQAGRDEQERFFRDIFSRAAITEREGRYFTSLIARAAQLVRKSSH